MTILLIGGYRFLGRAIVDAAVARGHEITAFNRGVTWPSELPNVELIVGDRSSDVGKLAGRTWDVAIDTSGYRPRAVAAAVDALAERVSHYTFVSSISVYPWPVRSGLREDGDVAELPVGEDPNGTSSQTYGERKVLCEREVTRAFGDRALLLRPGMIVGPFDETVRFTFWLGRASRGGRMLVPGEPTRRLQFIDVADLASFAVALAERRTAGALNVAGPLEHLMWETFIAACRQGTNATGEPVWVDDATLAREGFSPGAVLPWWVPANENGIFEIDITQARSLGLRCRPLAETVARTWQWLQALPADARPHGLDGEHESRLLAVAARQ